MKINPLGDRVLIKIAPIEEKTASGLFIPKTAQEKTHRGIVTAVGNGNNKELSLNDKVIYDKYAGTSIKLDGEDHLIIGVKDIIAIIED